jgi:hypothetical protein
MNRDDVHEEPYGAFWAAVTEPESLSGVFATGDTLNECGPHAASTSALAFDGATSIYGRRRTSADPQGPDIRP